MHVFPENQDGLSTIYNLAIEQFSNEPCTFVFAHDDIHILDFYWIHSILNGLNRFGIVGVAGNTRRVQLQPSWVFIDEKLTWDKPQFLSGVVGHGKNFPPENLKN